MTGRQPPPSGGSSSGNNNNNNNNNDLLLDLDNDQPYYSGGQRSTLNDDDLLRFHADDGNGAQSRPSVSYDDFLGSSQPTGPSTTQPLPGGPAASQRPTGPYSGVQVERQYSQTSELGNYQRYADDFDELPDDGGSYYQRGGNASGDNLAAARGNARNRNSVLGLGGGFFGRVKNRLGMGQGYSEMDLPLTDSRAGRTDSGGLEPPPPRQKGKFDVKNFKFGFGSVAAVDEDVNTNLFIEGSLAAALTALSVPLTTVGMASLGSRAGLMVVARCRNPEAPTML